MEKAIILFSGGLDSTTCLAIAQQDYACYALSFLYGQKHQVEIENAKKIAKAYGVIEHKVLSIPMDEIKGSSLTDSSLPVKDYDQAKGGQIPDTYVPARNTLFLSFALAWGEVLSAYNIFIGANFIDYSNYPDCRPDYLKAFEKLTRLGTKMGVEGKPFKIHAPLLYMKKADIIRKGLLLNVDYAQTISCYRADDQGLSCGTCDSCVYRKKGFLEARAVDPTLYA